MEKTIAVVFGGGHVSSWHAGLYGVLRKAEELGRKVIGFRDGFVGANSGNYFELTSDQIDTDRSGVVIGASRAKSDPTKVKDTFARLKRRGIEVEAVVGFCGDDHLKQLYALWSEEEIPVVGWPKTMDNDLSSTYFTLGYHTAATHAIEGVRRGYNTAWTYSRTHIVTMFGRDTDWVVAAAGGFAPADLTIGGEIDDSDVFITKYNPDYLVERIREVRENNKLRYGRSFAVIAVAEGAKVEGLETHLSSFHTDIHGHLKIEPEKLALGLKDELSQKDKSLGVSTDTLTYDNLRNSPPTPLDKRLSIRAGEACVEAIADGNYGVSVVVKEAKNADEIDVGTEPLAKVFEKRRLRPEGFMDYDNLKPTAKFLDYYAPIFGVARKHDEILPSRLEERAV